MDLEVLESIKKELKKRTEFDNTEDEKEYQQEEEKLRRNYASYEGSGTTPSELASRKRLKEDKLRKIRKKLNDDQGFFELFNKLGDLQKIYREMEKRLRNLRHPSFLKKMTIGKDEKLIDQLQKEIDNLGHIIYNIKTLEPIYNETGGKRKMRRNQKTKKSKKNRRKSKRLRKFVHNFL